MYECTSDSAFLVNVEVDSMGGVIDGGVGAGVKTSPCRAEIEKAQEEIRLEIDHREERLRELDFLEKGGDPLDFKFSHAVSMSVQSTSLTDQHPEQIVTSKAKDSYTSTALRSRHGEAIESFGKPGDRTCEANSGDNLLLFDDDNKLLKDKISKSRGSKNAVAPSEFSTRTGGIYKVKGRENSAIFRPYARRRSKSNRDGVRSASMDVAHVRNNQASTHLRPGMRDAKGSVSEAYSQDQKLSPLGKLKSPTRINGVVQKNDSVRNVDSAGIPTADKLTLTPHGGRKEYTIDSKANGESLSSRKDHEKTRDATSCSVGVEAEERTPLLSDATTTQPTGVACQTDGLDLSKKRNCTQNDEESGYPDITTVNLGIEPPKNDSDKCADRMNENSGENFEELVLVAEEANKPVTEDPQEIKINPKPVDLGSVVIGDADTDHDNKSSLVVKIEEDQDLENKSTSPKSLMTIKRKELEVLEVHKNQDNMIDHFCDPRDDEIIGIQTLPKAMHDVVSDVLQSGRDSTDKDVPVPQACYKKLTVKIDEDTVLAEAKLIQAKRKRIYELSTRSSPLENCQKSHWDFLLEEVAWLANDFMQERLWKITVAAQISRHAFLSSHVRDQKQMPVRRLKFIAHSSAKAVMDFWHSSELQVNDNSSCRINGPINAEIKALEDHVGGPALLEPLSPSKNFALKSYAMRFLRYNNSIAPSVEAGEQVTCNDAHDLGMQDTSGESCITEEDLFYAIPPGAMECYRTSVESYVSQREKNGCMHKADDTTMHDANEEMSQDNVYDEDEGETSTPYLPGTVEWSQSSKFPYKNLKGLKRTYTSGSYELGADLAYGNQNSGTQKSVLMVKRPASQNVISIPIKRMRTASRQRVLGSSSGVGTLNTLAMNKTDASSGDTNSYQDDQSSLHGGSQIQRGLEVESPVDFEKYLPIDSGEISKKHKKKKKPKNMNSSYEQRWLHESAILDDIGDYSKRRSDSHHFDSNGSNGWFGQHRNKKLRISKQTLENVLDNGAPTMGSMPSPVASQMSNMSNANEYKKIIANRDRLRKAKVTKLPIPVSGSGSAWTSFEDQALVVLVHDMGPNWELVSDAINSTLKFKRIFRGPKECKERHKVLMDQTTGDGADSADDSGSSQPYPSTMPGIPKGSARQLFQRLHAPMEEDTVKCHFEKIIMIGQKQHHRRKQCDSHDQKHVTPPHNSHMVAISQISPNNLNGGCLMPLDLIDAITSSPDALALGYQSPQSDGFANQSSVQSVLPPHGAVSNNLSSTSGPLSHRNGRYVVSRTSLPIDDQQRIQQLNPMFSGRNIQQSTIPVPGPHPLADRFGSRKLQSSNGMGMVNGINSRGMPMSRPGFQGLGSSASLDSTDVISSGMVGVTSLEMQSVIGSTQGNSIQKPLDNSHQIRPGQSLEHHRPELQMRGTQTNNHSVTPMNGLNGCYASQTGPLSVQSYSVHPQQKHQMSQKTQDLTNPHHPHLRGPNHAIGSLHPAYARLVKERQLQQQQMQQQQQYSASNAMMSQTQQHPPVSMQNSLQVQLQSSQVVSQSSIAPPSPMTPMYSQLQQKHHLPPNGIRDSQSGASHVPSQVTKQRQQAVRPHNTQQRQQLQSQHGKQFKGDGKVNMVMPQNVMVDQSNLNGQPPSPVGQSTDKGEQVAPTHGSHNSVQPSRSLGLQTSSQSQSQLQQKLYPSASHSPNQMQQVPLLFDNGNQGQVHSPSYVIVSSKSHQATSPQMVSSPSHPQIRLQSNSHQKHVGQTPVNVLRGPENSEYVSQLDEHSVSNDAPSDGNAATTHQACMDMQLIDERSSLAAQWQPPETLQESPLQNISSQLRSIGSPSTESPDSDSNLAVGSGSIRKQLSGGSTPSANSIGERWQQKSQIQYPVVPSTSQQQE